VLVLVGGVAAVAAVAERGLGRRPAARALLLAVVTWAALGGRSLAKAGHQLAGAVRCGNLEARRLAPTLVGRDPSRLDGPELCRAALESVAENTADAVVGPLLWGVLAGPAGVAAYRSANTLDAMVGHHSARGVDLGFKGWSQHCLLLTGSTVARRGPRRVFSSRGSCGVGC
jgi:adenosylcobinamide-phosphate synthase